MRCGTVTQSKRRGKYCQQECILKKAAAPFRPLYGNRRVVGMGRISKRDKMRVDAARKALTKARSRARDAERNLKAAQRALDSAKRIADRNISRAKADAVKAKEAAMPKKATPKRAAKAHVAVSRQTSAITKPGGKTKRAAGASTAAMGATTGVKRSKHRGKNYNGKACEICGKAITGRKSRKYCSDKCLYEKNNELGRLRNRNNPEKVREYRQRWRKNNPKITIGQVKSPVVKEDGPTYPEKRTMSRYLITLTYLYYAQYLVVDAAKPADAVDIARALVPHDWSARDTSMLRVYEAPLTAVMTSKWLQMTSTLDMHIEQRTSMCSRKVGL